MSLRTLFTSTSVAVILAIATGGAGVAEDKIIAKIGDQTITEQELAFAQADLQQQFARVPEKLRKAAILNALIDIKVMALAAEKEKFDQTDQFKTRMAFLKARALHNAYFQKNIAGAITDDAIKARYDKEVAATPAEKEISARHILVKTEEEAKAIIKQLDEGGKFEELAKSKSTGPSGANGGSLGFFKKGQMVPEFEAAAFALENGKYTSAPVKTQFGWHIIKKEEERNAPPPAFDDVKDRIRQILMREKYVNLITGERKGHQVEIIDKDLKSGIEQLNTAR